MLSIGKLAAGQADYYLQQAQRRVDRSTSVSTGVEDYYLGGPEAAGDWMGGAAAALGVAGEVDDEGIRRALAGRAPATGELLPRRPLRVPGFDVTFSAPKTVSVLFGIGTHAVREAIRDSHDAAVRDAFGYLERQAAVSRRGHGGHELVPGNGLLAAAFRHRTSRAGDPQLHTHILVANVTMASDGQWRALDGRRLYAHARTAGFLYEFRLRAEMTRRLGVGWQRPRNGIADVEGVSRQVVRVFSRRRVEIEAELERVGRSGATAARVAALDTRRRKDYDVRPEDLAPEWRERAARLGLDLNSIESEVLSRRAAPEVSVDELAGVRNHLASSDGLTHTRSTFTRRDAIQAWCERLPTGVDMSVSQVETEVDRMLTSAAFVPLLAPRPAGGAVIRRRDGRIVAAMADERRYSTPELLAAEQRIIAQATTAAAAPTATATAVDTAIRERGTLAPEQVAMVRRLTLDPSRVTVVVGKAGTGKTFALDAAREAWERSGVPVAGAAIARRAARELEESAGIVSTSVAALLGDLRRGGPYGLVHRSVLVVDEASLVPTRQLAELLDHVVFADAKLVLVGDHHQLPAIQAGGAFRGLALRLGAIELTENRRQVEAWERAALDRLREGHARETLRTYAANDRLLVGEDAISVREALVGDWWRTGDPDGSLMIAFRRADVRDLNVRARALLAGAERLGAAEIELRSGSFATGDRVVLRRNDRRQGVANGDRGTVVRVDADATVVEVSLRSRRVRLDASYLAPLAGRPGLVHGYAVTGHIAQGMTVDRAFVLGTQTLSKEWGYVALSRGRTLNRFYAVAGEAAERDEFAPQEARDEPMDEIAQALERSHAELLAMDTTAAVRVSTTPTRLLRDEASRLRNTAGGEAHAVARQLSRVRIALADIEPTLELRPTGSRRWFGRKSPARLETDLDTSRRTTLRAEEARLAAAIGRADTHAAVRVALIEEELARRERLNSAARRLDPTPEMLEAIGPRPERPADLRRWRRAAGNLHRTDGRARGAYRRLVG